MQGKLESRLAQIEFEFQKNLARKFFEQSGTGCRTGLSMPKNKSIVCKHGKRIQECTECRPPGSAEEWRRVVLKCPRRSWAQGLNAGTYLFTRTWTYTIKRHSRAMLIPLPRPMLTPFPRSRRHERLGRIEKASMSSQRYMRELRQLLPVCAREDGPGRP